MRQKNKTSFPVLTVLVVLALSTSCRTTDLRNKEIENVAKDWSLVIRASQVIPVYPLTEDIQPGDVLLVSTPIDDQECLYKKNGFLPLDQHLVRLYPKDYREFYNSRYGIDDSNIPPGKWQTVNPKGEHNWKIAPHVAFPTYQFSVKTVSGLSSAIPIQGVPFALGLMNSGSASGTVTISDAYTYGLDNYRIERIVRDWAFKNRTLLRNYEPHQEHHFLFLFPYDSYHFLRVISRVYVTGRLIVTVTNDETTGVTTAAGAERSPINLAMDAGKKDSSSKNWGDILNRIDSLAKDKLPGANFKAATATSRSVTFSEDITKPLVIGYVGFDMPILKDGRLGAPISTLAQLTGRPQIQTSLSSSTTNIYRVASFRHMYDALVYIEKKPNSADSEAAKSIRTKLDALDQLLPKSYPFSLYMSTSPTEIQKHFEIVAGASIKREGFKAVLDYVGNANTTVEKLESYLQKNTDPQLAQNLQSAEDALKAIDDLLCQEPILMEAINFVFFRN